MGTALNENEQLFNDKKQIVSMRLNNADRNAVRSTAARLFVRESELYRFAVYHMLHRLHKLHDDSCSGSDLLPLFLEIREELTQQLGLKKHQLFKIFNGKNTAADKFVAMSDIELLLLPQHVVRQRLLQTNEALPLRQSNTSVWLESYLHKKYGINRTESDEDFYDENQSAS